MAEPTNLQIYTVGHSNIEVVELVMMLRAAGVEAVVDVRSQPQSKWAPQFNREHLTEELQRHGLTYRWEPRLGGRPTRNEMYTTDGRVRYGKLAETPEFRKALEELVLGAAQTPTSIMCAEADPKKCHRRLLVGRALRASGGKVEVHHILSRGAVVEDSQLEESEGQPGLFSPDELDGGEWVSAVAVKPR